MRLTSFAIATAVVAGALGMPAGAQEARPSATGQVITDAVPTSAAASYACGGVGDAEQRQFKAEAAEHDMMLTFATPTGAYLADVDVKISTAEGAPVLQVHCDGPLMLVDLPGAGRYQVEAWYQGKRQHKTVAVGARTARTSFVWTAS